MEDGVDDAAVDQVLSPSISSAQRIEQDHPESGEGHSSQLDALAELVKNSAATQISLP